MTADRYIDPVAGDYVPAGPGWRVDDQLWNQVTLSWTIPLGSWEGDPELGHEFGELARWTAGAGAAERVRELALSAIQWLIDGGDIVKAEIDAAPFGDDGVAFEARLWPRDRSEPMRSGLFRVRIGGG